MYFVGSCKQSSDSARLTVPHNSRCELSETNAMPAKFFMPNLLGGSIEYDVDLSQAGCSCNAALYLNKMPGKDVGGGIHYGGSKE